MQFDAAVVIQAGSGLLYMLLGATILVLGRRRLALAAMGIGLAAFGATFVISNVFMSDPATLDAAVLANAFLYALAALGLCLFALAHPRPLTTRIQLSFLAITGFAVAVSLGGALRLPEDFGRTFYGSASSRVVNANQAAFVALYCVFGLLIMAGAFRARSSPKRERVAYMLVAIGAGAYVAFNSAATLAPTRGWDPAIMLMAFGTPLAMILLGAAMWVQQLHTQAPRLGRNVILALAASALLGAAYDMLHFPGEIGILRILGATLIAFAVFKYDLLGVELSRITVARGPLAAGALATLFIVAQIAQNFLAAQYGLLMGGIVAGAVLFAASPIQRAVERVRDAPSKDGGRALHTPHLENEDAYRRALRIALRDRLVTADEEVHLADLGERLGIRAGRARELRHDVERETGGER